MMSSLLHFPRLSSDILNLLTKSSIPIPLTLLRLPSLTISSSLLQFPYLSSDILNLLSKSLIAIPLILFRFSQSPYSFLHLTISSTSLRLLTQSYYDFFNPLTSFSILLLFLQTSSHLFSSYNAVNLPIISSILSRYRQPSYDFIHPFFFIFNPLRSSLMGQEKYKKKSQKFVHSRNQKMCVLFFCKCSRYGLCATTKTINTTETRPSKCLPTHFNLNLEYKL